MTGRTFHGRSGDVSIQPYGKPDWVTYSIARGELNQALLGFVQRRSEVRVHYGHACLHADLEPPTLVLRALNGRVKTVAADLIVGADGVASAVRSAMLRLPGSNFAKIVFPGKYRELTLRCASGGFPFYEHAIHIWPRADFFMVALPNRDRTFRGTLVIPDKLARRLRAPEAMQALLETQFPDILPYLAETAAELLRRPAGEIVGVRCEALHHAGSALLLGDAAHAVVPFMGQGVNMGLEDCGALERRLDEHGSDLERAFAALTDERLPEALACADLSEWNWNELTSGRPVVAAHAEDSLVSQVNFSGLSYRKVAERAIPNWRPRVVATAHAVAGGKV